MTTTKRHLLPNLLVALYCLTISIFATPQDQSPTEKPIAPASKSAPAEEVASSSDDALKAELDTAMALEPIERVARLEAFIKANTESSLKLRARELLTSARAALGDEQLRAGNAADGIGQFRQAVAEVSPDMPDKLFVEVISQLPANLFIRGEGVAALDLARRIENKIKDNPSRLLALAAFYLGIEQGTEAARIAELSIKLAPDVAAAHQALGFAHRIALQLEPAAVEFARALEIDPKLASARRNLADLRRATGKPAEALALYREQLTIDANDVSARTGVVLSLFASGNKEEAEKELKAALQQEARNLPLLVGAAYWYAAHGEGARALELAEQAVRIEPRYTWAHIAFARALVTQKRPLEAERALRFARQYGRFPTLDYELANTLAAAGLYAEAAEELARSFKIKDDEIETQLAGRAAARAANFIELLAPERRASIYQFDAADTEHNARMLKALLKFHLATNEPGESSSTTRGDRITRAASERESATAAAVRAAQDFALSTGSNADEMSAFRQLYIAGRLLQHGISMPTVIKATEAAVNGVEAALDTPIAAVAVLADSLRDIRTRAIAAGATTDIPAVPRVTLSNIMRGRIEDIAGWALYSQGKAAEATVRLRRAASVLPENTLWWRDAMWHLGNALDISGNQTEALTTLLRSYDRQSPNPARRAIIEALYARVNGSLDNLDAKLGVASSTAARTNTPSASAGISTAATDAATTQLEPTPQTATPLTAAATSQVIATPDQPTPAPVEQSSEATRTTETMPREAAQKIQSTPPADTPSMVVPTTPRATKSKRARTPRQQSSDDDSSSNNSHGKCALSFSERSLTINRGESATLTISADEASNLANISAATSDWSHLLVLAEPQTAASGNSSNVSLKYAITSTSKTAGTHTIIFTSPCGKQEITVTVK